MKILVIGSGGREHAITWKLSQSAHQPELYCAPGNAGIAQIATCVSANAENVDGLAELASSLRADLTVVGPEVPLVAGVADLFARRGLPIVGPTAAAARLEGSKIFAKQFMDRHGIPTARFMVCDSPGDAARVLEREYTLPVVVKADGLAAGKGVRIATTRQEFDLAIQQLMVDRVFGESGSRVLIEECLTGREASLMLFTDGRNYQIMAPAQDYKRVDDGDRGPNTGGMGSYSTPGLIADATIDAIKNKIIERTLAGMAGEGAPFAGILYVGLMLTSDGPMVIEFNARFGDPETQAVLTRLDTDLVDIFSSIAGGDIDTDIEWSRQSSVCVVMTSGGYPGSFEKGKVISGLKEAADLDDVVVFHAGTALGSEGSFLTSGGRVLGVTATADSLAQARNQAYAAVSRIEFDAMHYRTDIAAEAGR
jgi:phosphoribosylamine---glycine ligase